MKSEEEFYCHYSGLPSPAAYSEPVTEPAQELLSPLMVDRIIEMAWEDRTPFDAIRFQFGLSESDVKILMKEKLRFSSYKSWRRRVEACKTKHALKRGPAINRFKCNLQRTISQNKLSKRK